jgi:probable HAF family extracellular repeat protein
MIACSWLESQNARLREGIMYRIRWVASSVIGILLGLLTAASALAHSPSFTVRFSPPVLIDAPNGLSTVGIDINNFGTVVGQFSVTQQLFRAFVWSPEQGFLELAPTGNEHASSANAINDCGEIAGEASVGPQLNARAVLWRSSEQVENLGTLPGGEASYATGINEWGHVVGFSQTADIGAFHAFLWTKAAGMRDLGTLGGLTSVARAINNRNEVVGTSDTSNGEHHAFFWSQRTGMIDVGTKGFEGSDAFAINDDGVVVGVVASGFGTQGKAFRWTRARGMALLGDFGNPLAVAHGLNTVGFIVGEAVDDALARRATLWLHSKRVINIDPSTGITSGASHINDRGQIIGSAAFRNLNDLRAAVWQMQGYSPPPDYIPAVQLCRYRK